MRLSPLRISIAVVGLGVLVAVGGLTLGSAPTRSERVDASGEVVTSDDPVTPDIIPDLGDQPEVVRGSPGSREQVALLGGLIAALGLLGVLGSISADAARRAREGGAGGRALPAQ